MSKVILFAMVAAGLALTFLGAHSSTSVNAELTQMLTGTPNYKALVMLAAGITVAIAGLAGLFRGTKGR